MALLRQIGIQLPIFQAPMAGTATPAMAAAVSNAGGLGSINLSTTNAASARKTIEELQKLTARPFHVNFFVHATAKADVQRESAWLDFLKPVFEEFGAKPPTSLRTIYNTFAEEEGLLDVLLETKPKVVSFHFGLPSTASISALKSSGALLLATATSLSEALQIEAAGLDGIIAQGIEAGGHRGVFDPAARDESLPTFALTRLLVRRTKLPVIAAGGIMDGAGIAAALDLGASAVQLGTAFVPCDESAADASYRSALLGSNAYSTTMTRLISGRPARTLCNRFSALTDKLEGVIPPEYPIAYDAGKALHAAAKAKGDGAFGAQWAGQGAPLARAMPAADLVAVLEKELREAQNER